MRRMTELWALWPVCQQMSNSCFLQTFFCLFVLSCFFCASPAAVQSLNNLNDQIAHFVVARPCSLADEDEAFIPAERDSLKKSMTLMRHLLMDAQVAPPAVTLCEYSCRRRLVSKNSSRRPSFRQETILWRICRNK